MTRRIINLSDNQWHFGQVPRRSFTAPDVYDLPAVTEWLPATVPGNVRTDLLALDQLQITLDETIIQTQTLDLPADSAYAAGRLTRRLTSPPYTISLTLDQGSETFAKTAMI